MALHMGSAGSKLEGFACFCSLGLECNVEHCMSKRVQTMDVAVLDARDI